jgi:predicted nucleotidyltransferase
MGGFEIVDQRYGALYERLCGVLEADPRVASVGLSGSLASDTADEWSDLDVAVVAHPEHHASLLADWPTWLAEITPTVFARTTIAPFIVNALTVDGLTLDVAIWSGRAFNVPPPTQYVVGQLSNAKYDTIELALEYAVEEQLRGLAGPFISLLKREEHVRHLTGVSHLIGLLTIVFLAETNRAQPGKRWNDTFTAEQRNAIACLPAVRATQADLTAFGLGIGELIVTRARLLYPGCDLVWPSALANVAASRLRSELEIDTSGWLF